MRVVTELIPEAGDKLIEYKYGQVVGIYTVKWIEIGHRLNASPALKVHAESGRGTDDFRTVIEWGFNLEWWGNTMSDEVKVNGKHWARQL